MDHRHLQPYEIDLLLDGDTGFGLAPLKAHVSTCAHCQGELDQARRVVDVLEALPHFGPSARFSDQVMAQVQVFEPWHVTLRDSLRGLVPRSRPARVLAAAGGFGAALVLTVVSVALLGRLDILVFGWGLLADRGRSAAFALLRDVVATVFGETAFGSVVAGPGSFVLLLGVLAGSLVAALLVLRALTASHRRQRI